MSEETKPESAAAIRAMAVQECIDKLSEGRVPPKFSNSSDWDDGYNDGISDGIDRLRALSPAPQVTEEWVEQRVHEALFSPSDPLKHLVPFAFRTVRATLAALGVEVKP